MGDAIGFSLAIGSSFLAALGYVLQKRAHNAQSLRNDKLPLWKNVEWLSGLACMVASAGLAVASSVSLPQSVSAPMGSVTIVCSSVLAALLAGEKFTVLDIISTAIIISGAVVAVTANDAPSDNYTFPETVDLLSDSVVYAYSALAVVAFAVGGSFVERTARLPFASWSKRTRAVFSLASPALGGFAMGYTGYSSKVVATSLLNAESAAFSNGLFYVYIFVLTVAVTLQVRWLNKGLAFFSALAIVPVFQSSIIFSNSLAGIVYFHDMRSSAPWRLGVFALGALTCMVGIGLLLLKKSAPETPAKLSPRLSTTPTAEGDEEGEFSGGSRGGGGGRIVLNPLQSSLAATAGSGGSDSGRPESGTALPRSARVQQAMGGASSPMPTTPLVNNAPPPAASSAAGAEVPSKPQAGISYATPVSDAGLMAIRTERSSSSLLTPPLSLGASSRAPEDEKWWDRELLPLLRDAFAGRRNRSV